jgi:hypothetical protein
MQVHQSDETVADLRHKVAEKRIELRHMQVGSSRDGREWVDEQVWCGA